MQLESAERLRRAVCGRVDAGIEPREFRGESDGLNRSKAELAAQRIAGQNHGLRADEAYEEVVVITGHVGVVIHAQDLQADVLSDLPGCFRSEEKRVVTAEGRVVDPEGRKEGEALLPGVTWVEDSYDAAHEADAIVVLTEWNQFRGLDLARLAQSMRGNVMVDLRNIYMPEDASAAGFAYTSVGRG